MELRWDSKISRNQPLSLAEIYDFEQSTAEYLLSVLLPPSPTADDEQDGNVNNKNNGESDETTTNPLGSENKATYVAVSVRDQEVSADGSNRRYIDAVVTLLSSTTKANNIDLDTVLMYAIDPQDLPFINPRLSFGPFDNTTVLESFEDASKTAADIALITTTAVLSVMLIAISSVLLYITGGWQLCWVRFTNCLFVEVIEDDDEYMIDNKNTFQVESVYGDEMDQQGDGADDGSLETGMQTNPTGILGAEDHRVYIDENGNPTTMTSMVQTTPSAPRDYDGSFVADTPMTESSRPLGIASMREMPSRTLDTPHGGDNNNNNKQGLEQQQTGGLAGMIMERLAQYGQQ